MQNIQKIILLTICLFNQATFTQLEFILTPENTIICSDIDEVLTKKTPWAIFNLLYVGLAYDALNIGTYIKAIYKAEKTYTKNADGKRGPLYDQYANVVNGFTFHLLFHGMRDNNLMPYIELVLETVESSRCFIEDTKKIYDYLRYKKGYTIVFATNNDHVAYEISSNALGEEFTQLADCVFVAHPGNSSAFLTRLQDFAMQSTTPEVYKKLLHRSLTIQPTKNIIHTPGKKPDYEYYHFIEQHLDPHKNIVFIDDQKENIDGFNVLQKNNNALRCGIQFKSPQQLAEDFIAVGILSEAEDKELLEEIHCSGFINCMLRKIKKTITFIMA